MAAFPIVIEEPGRQRLAPLGRRGVGAPVGPLTKQRLDESLGLAVSPWRIGPSAPVAQSGAPTQPRKAIRDVAIAVVEYEDMQTKEATPSPWSGYPFLASA